MARTCCSFATQMCLGIRILIFVLPPSVFISCRLVFSPFSFSLVCISKQHSRGNVLRVCFRGGQHAAGDLRRTCVRLHLPSLTPPLFRSFATWSGPCVWCRPGLTQLLVPSLSPLPSRCPACYAPCQVSCGVPRILLRFKSTSLLATSTSARIRATSLLPRHHAHGICKASRLYILSRPCLHRVHKVLSSRVPSFCEPGVSLDAHAGVYFRVSIVPWDGGNQAIWKRDETYRQDERRRRDEAAIRAETSARATRGDETGGRGCASYPRYSGLAFALLGGIPAACETRRDETSRDGAPARATPDEVPQDRARLGGVSPFFGLLRAREGRRCAKVLVPDGCCRACWCYLCWG
ncbi:hypothetical protein B0H12DRAFT_783510 [Mycena haematopus]|nr:hypothetical protein B0H12DRAFT_783510 [Mycena haematopus]